MTTTWSNTFKHPIDFLLKEDGGFLLQEDNASKLILEQTGSSASLWTNLSPKH